MDKEIVYTAVTGRYEAPEYAASEIDCIAGQSFGYRVEGGEHYPGPVNERLGELAVRAAQEYGAPIVAQQEIAEAIEGYGGEVAHSITQHRVADKYLDMGEVLLQTKDYMSRHNMYRGIAIAHAYHVGRVVSQARKMGVELNPYPELPTEFDPDSAQVWTRNRALWVSREIPVLATRKARGMI
jgi:hypothetical protein